jgi:hypothetical protein
MTAARRLRLMLFGFAIAVGAVAALNFLVNPWGAWRFHLVAGKYRRVREDRLVTPYLLRTSAPQTLLLGSSRVLYGMKIEQGVRDGFQNAALSGSRLPEISKEVDLALRNPHLKRIIWGVDFYIFDSYLNLCSPDTCARLDGDLRIKLTDNILSSDTFVASYRMVLRALMGKISPEAKLPIPWPAPVICGSFADPPEQSLARMGPKRLFFEVSHLPEYRHFNYAPELRQSFLDIVGRIRDAHVQLIAFVPPLSQFELEMMRQTGRWGDFQAWKRFLAEHLNYTDFSGYNRIARSDRLFMDAWHMEPAVGATIMRELLADPLPQCPDAALVADSALAVNAGNADQILALQERRMEQATASPNLYSTTVAAAIAQRYGRIAVPALSARR